jgi:hypothetical protein
VGRSRACRLRRRVSQRQTHRARAGSGPIGSVLRFLDPVPRRDNQAWAGFVVLLVRQHDARSAVCVSTFADECNCAGRSPERTTAIVVERSARSRFNHCDWACGSPVHSCRPARCKRPTHLAVDANRRESARSARMTILDGCLPAGVIEPRPLMSPAAADVKRSCPSATLPASPRSSVDRAAVS